MATMTLDQLREQLRGEVAVPGDTVFDEARAVMNGMIDRRPAAVVRVANAGDVIATVNYARENALDLSVRGGAGTAAPGSGPTTAGRSSISPACVAFGSIPPRRPPGPRVG